MPNGVETEAKRKAKRTSEGVPQQCFLIVLLPNGGKMKEKRRDCTDALNTKHLLKPGEWLFNDYQNLNF